MTPTITGMPSIIVMRGALASAKMGTLVMQSRQGLCAAGKGCWSGASCVTLAPSSVQIFANAANTDDLPTEPLAPSVPTALMAAGNNTTKRIAHSVAQAVSLMSLRENMATILSPWPVSGQICGLGGNWHHPYGHRPRRLALAELTPSDRHSLGRVPGRRRQRRRLADGNLPTFCGFSKGLRPADVNPLVIGCTFDRTQRPCNADR